MRYRAMFFGSVIGLFCFSTARTGFSQASSSVSAFQSRLEMGQTLYTQGRYHEAEAVFQQAIKFDRKRPEGHLGLGLVYLRMKNRRLDARAAFQEATRLDPQNAQVHYYLGLTYVERGSVNRGTVYQDGRVAFQRAIELNPQHPDAYYQLALSYEYPSQEYGTAISLYFQQLLVTPRHHDALVHLGKSCFQTGWYREGVGLLTQLVDAKGKDIDPMVWTLIAQLSASYFQAQKQYDRVLKVYEQYLALLDPSERALYTDLTYVVSEEELKAYQQVSGAAREECWRTFWAARDPNPATVVNERLVEHYRRVMYAREHFSRGKYPWDRRGDIYIRYGEPDDRQRVIVKSYEDPEVLYRPTGNLQVDTIRQMNRRFRYRLKVNRGGVVEQFQARGSLAPAGEEDEAARGSPSPLSDTELDREASAERFILKAQRVNQALAFVVESWVYVPYTLELFFVDQLNRGIFDYPLPIFETYAGEAARQEMYHPQKLAEELIKKSPDGYQFDYGGQPLDFRFDTVTYKGHDGQTQVEVAYSVPTSQLGTVQDGQGLKTWFDSHLVLRDAGRHPVVAAEEKIGPIERPLATQSEQAVGVELRTTVLSVLASAGTYRSAIEVRDMATKRIGIFENTLAVADYGGDSLRVSDIRLATAIKPVSHSGRFVRHGLEIQPNPTRLYRRAQPVYLYYEVYNLQPDRAGQTAYQTTLEITPKQKQTRINASLYAGRGRSVRQVNHDQSLVFSFEDAGTASDDHKYTAIDTSNSPAGVYTLTVTVTDLQTNQHVSKTTEFTLVAE